MNVSESTQAAVKDDTKVGMESEELRGTSVLPPLLSVIIPVFNERETIERVIATVLSVPLDLEVIVVDDGSGDGTQQLLSNVNLPRTRVLFHEQNRGKGSAIRTGLTVALGELTVIQDADLEYDPQELPLVIGPLQTREAEVVYGSRYLEENSGEGFRLFRYGVSFLNVVVRMMYGQKLSDSATCYKAAPTDLLRHLDLQCERFEFCPEVTSKICRMGIDILEVPISYFPRSSDEGKKIRARDGWDAFKTYLKYRSWQPRSQWKRAEVVNA